MDRGIGGRGPGGWLMVDGGWWISEDTHVLSPTVHTPSLHHHHHQHLPHLSHLLHQITSRHLVSSHKPSPLEYHSIASHHITSHHNTSHHIASHRITSHHIHPRILTCPHLHTPTRTHSHTPNITVCLPGEPLHACLSPYSFEENKTR